MCYLKFSFYLALCYALATKAFSAIHYEPTESNILQSSNQISADDLDTAIRETMKDLNLTGESQSLFELVGMIHNATEGNYDINETRRSFEWIKKLFSKSTPTTPPSTVATEYVTTLTPQEPLVVQKYLIEVLQNMTEVLQRLNQNIELQNDLSPLKVVPLSTGYRDPSRYRRRKREAPTKDYNVSVDFASNASVLSNTSATAPPLPDSLVNPVSNLSSSQEESTACSQTRRAQPDSNPAVKRKLLGFLNDTFQEIATKIQPVQQIKKVYANDSMFRIGYVMANIDTLEVSIMNLRHDMDIHKDSWEDTKILDMFDKIMVSNKVVTSLIQSLKEMQQKSVLLNNNL